MPRQPLAEVFGFPISNTSKEAEYHRQHKFCPFQGNQIPCTKDKANDPLGVCSVHTSVNTDALTITCPVRFTENQTIMSDAAEFFFTPETKWTALPEIRLKDCFGKSAGNIDVVLAAYDEQGKITDFGSLEIQAVYISGNVRDPFVHYMEDRIGRSTMEWRGVNYPKADFLSSSRKRLAPQLLFKGGILKSWNKKQAVALHTSFYNTLPELPEVPKEEAEIAWFLYDLILDPDTNAYKLTKTRTLYTMFESALFLITTAQPGDINEFQSVLQTKINQQKALGLPGESVLLVDPT